jgi:nitrile hydratase accessory protein
MNSDLPPVSGVPLDHEGPVFSAPWEAEAFALAIALHERKIFSWPDFADELSKNIAADPSGNVPYYEHWLTAVETLVVKNKITTEPELDDRIEAWHEAAEATPHGKPILLFGTRER